MAPSKQRPRSPSLSRRASGTRRLIVGAAERAFARDGLAGARTDRIAAAAGVNKALLYYYFQSKDDLFRAVMEDHVASFYRRAIEVLDKENSAQATLVEYVSAHFDFIARRPHYPYLFHRFVMAGDRRLARVVKKYFLPIRRKLAQVIARGQRRGELRRTDIEHTAISLAGLTVFYFSAAPFIKLLGRKNPYDPDNLRRRKEAVLEFIRYGLFRSAEARRS